MNNHNTETIRIITITPDDAKTLLEKNFAHNRTVLKQRVAGYADDMARGEWKITGDPIRIDTDGNLIDGQHRLLAIIKAGVPIRTSFITGVDHSIVRLIDTGRGRSLKDALRIEGGGSEVPELAAAIGLVKSYEKYMQDKINKSTRTTGVIQRSSGNRSSYLPNMQGITRPQAFEILERRPTLTESARAIMSVVNARRTQPVRPPTGALVLMHNIATYGYGGGSVIEFAEAVRSGIGELGDPTLQLHGLVIRHLIGQPNHKIIQSLMPILWYRAYNLWTIDNPGKGSVKRTSGRSYPTIPGDVEWYLDAPPEDTP